MKRFIVIFLILCLALSLTACSSKKDEAKKDVPNYTGGEIVGSDLTGSGGARLFRAETIALPDTEANVLQAVKAGGEVFIYARTGDILSAQASENNRFYFLSANGTLTTTEAELGNTVVSIDGSTDGGAYVLTMAADGTYILSQVSATGEPISKVLMFLADREDAVWGVTVTDQGYLVKTADNILCYDLSGRLTRELGPFTDAYDLIKNPSEVVLALIHEDSTTFHVLDQNFEITASYDIPIHISGASTGPQNGHVFAADSGIIYDVDFTTGARVAYASAYSSGGAGNFIYLADDCYFGIDNWEPVLYSLSDEEGNREIKTLTLATYAPDEYDIYDLLEGVRKFNGMSRDYRIDVTNYGLYDEAGGEKTGLQRLNADILAGNTPDIYDLSCLSYHSFYKNGLLENLYPYFDTSDNISLDDLTSSAVHAMEYKGALYSLVPAYSVATMYGPSTVADPDTWSPEAFLEIANSTSLNLFGPQMTKSAFLRYLLAFTGSEYIDLENASCNFVSSSFPAMLSIAARLPDDNSASNASDDWGLIFTGQQLFAAHDNGNIIVSLCFAEGAYSGNAVVLGFPSNNNGIAINPYMNLGMSSNSEHKAGVWDFFEMLLSDEYQSGIKDRLPIKKTALNARLDAFVSRKSETTSLVGFADNQIYQIPLPLVTSALKDEALQMIDRIDCVDYCDSGLYELVLREATPFFQGGITAQQAAENIQSKVGIYLSEQFG